MCGILLIFDGAFGLTKRCLQAYTDSSSQRRKMGLKPGLMKKYTMVGSGETKFDAEISLDLTELNYDAFSVMKSRSGCYYYELTGQEYGFLRNEIEEELSKFKTMFLVVRHLETIEQLKQDFSGSAFSIYIQMPQAQLINEMAERFTEDQLKLHINRYREAWTDFVHHRPQYNHVLVNNGQPSDLYHQLDGIIQLCRPLTK